MRLFLSTILITLLIGNLYAQNNPRIDWQFGALGNDLGEAGIVTYDIDGNGTDEIIATSNNYSYSYFSVLEYSNTAEDYVIKWISNIINSSITTIKLFDFNEDGYKEIYLGLSNGMIYVYDTKNYNKIYEFDTSKRGETPFYGQSNSVTCIVFEDINNDSQLNISATNGDTTYIYNSSYTLINKLLYGSKYFVVGNIDNDPHNEIAYSNGIIIQLTNDEIKPEHLFYTHNKDVKIWLSDMNSDNTNDIIYTSQDTIFVYDFKEKKLIWSQKWETDYYSNFYITGIWLSDYDGDSTKDVFIGNDRWEAVYCYNGISGNKDFSLKDVRGDGVTNVAVSDLDNDSNMEIIWSTGANCSCPDFFFIYDLSTQTKNWQSKHLNRNFTAFDIGDVDNDGQLEIVLCNFGAYLNVFDKGVLTIFDAESKNVEWENYSSTYGGADNYTSVLVGDIDNDSDNELLIGIESNYAASYIYVLDSNYNIERRFSIHGMDLIIDMKIYDLDNDGKNELIVTSGTNISGSSSSSEWQNYIYIFDGASGELKWKSEQLAGIGSKIGMLNIANIDNDDDFEIIALKFVQKEDQNTLIIIDGTSYETIQDKSFNYTAITVDDFDKDGIYDILAATDIGIIEVLDGSTLLSKQSINTSLLEINSISTYDMNADNISELIITDKYSLSLFDVTTSKIKWISDTINFNIGVLNSIKIGNFDLDNRIEIVVNVNHGIFSFEANYDSIIQTNSVEKPHSIIYPNPVYNNLKIEIETDKPSSVQIKIFDIIGRIIMEEHYTDIDSRKTIQLDVSNLISGIYQVVVVKNDKIYSSNKMIKIK